MYKNKLCSLILLASLALPASAQSVNIIPNAVTTNTELFNNPTDFYKVWSCRYADNTAVEEEYLPYSIFSQVVQYGTVRCVDYKQSRYSISADEEAGFTADAPLIVLNYPVDAAFNECFYSLPINVPAQGQYTLSGCTHSIVTQTYTSSSFMNTKNLMVFVAEKELSGSKTFAIVKQDGKNVLEVRDANGNLLPSTYSPLPVNLAASSYSFSGALNLDPSYKYLSIYAPVSTWMVGNMKMDSEEGIFSNIKEVSSADFSDAPAEWFDLSGRRLSSGSEPSAKGVYILRQGSKSKLILR